MCLEINTSQLVHKCENDVHDKSPVIEHINLINLCLPGSFEGFIAIKDDEICSF